MVHVVALNPQLPKLALLAPARSPSCPTVARRRMLYAFARYNGLPFSRFARKLNKLTQASGTRA